MKKLFINPYFYLLIFWLSLVVFVFAQKSNYDYTLTIKVEGKSLEESMKIKDELTRYCQKNNISIDTYAKKEFEEIQRSNFKKSLR